MVDFHTHILHCIDDGSASIETSLKMLREEYSQGVKRVVLTPHFYAYRSGFSAFLAERNKKFQQLKDLVQNEKDMPKLSLGAEVEYFIGIDRCERIKELSIDDTGYLLLEMPFAKWNNEVVKDVLRIGENFGISVIIAHVNRYYYFGNAKAINTLIDNGISLQLNSECVFDKKMKKESLNLLSNQSISFIGSDCHNLDTRVPNLIKLKQFITENFGEEYFEELNDFQEGIFRD